MGTPGEHVSDVRNSNGYNGNIHSEHRDVINIDSNLDDYQLVSRHNRKRRNNQSNQEASSNLTYTPKRKTTEDFRSFSSEKRNIHETTTTSTSSYFKY
ncbi:unnamed protein product [Rotaria sp. Silwood2]|nr:unnamed protein product [Rotaria sp. Silwood2]CAF2837919.1 unnamed protein product [Rotaria sp. Silwood2]CAF3079406.1 unnamed protein product [Rotaria sp. Silwood2]CAF3259526.1 unnamed protein product [Rotaria sp. Silwood2]CAF4034695.1 unnamed protein product [Rotaria sp. Silwood2]